MFAKHGRYVKSFSQRSKKTFYRFKTARIITHLTKRYQKEDSAVFPVTTSLDADCGSSVR